MNQVLQAAQTGSRAARLRCEFSIGQSIGHVVVWVILILITFGIAGFFYLYRVVRVVLSDTVIEYY